MTEEDFKNAYESLKKHQTTGSLVAIVPPKDKMSPEQLELAKYYGIYL